MPITAISGPALVLASSHPIAFASQVRPETDAMSVIIVKDTITRILKTLLDDSLSAEQARDRIDRIAGERINYYELSKRILAVN